MTIILNIVHVQCIMVHNIANAKVPTGASERSGVVVKEHLLLWENFVKLCKIILWLDNIYI